MESRNTMDKKDQILMGVYSLSWGNSMIALMIVCVLEIFMLIYTVLNASLYGDLIWRYRAFYISLLTVAVVYIILNIFVKKDMEHRYRLLNFANPISAVFFFLWALGVTWSDASVNGAVDPTIFMTFSLVVPLSFFLYPVVYALIVVAANALMIYLTVAISGSVGPLINLVIFFIFQFVLGISFLRLKMSVAERIITEKENARIDVLTELPNRRTYEEEMKRFSEQPIPNDLIYIAVDVNRLKEINDSKGHEAGDKLLIGAARTMEQAFGCRGKMYRIGGDEFVILLFGRKTELPEFFECYEKNMKNWSESSGLPLSSSYGYVCYADHPECSITDIARMADQELYKAKAAYYTAAGKNRRGNSGNQS